MRKYVLTGLFVVIIVAAAGIVHARGGLIGSHSGTRQFVNNIGKNLDLPRCSA